MAVLKVEITYNPKRYSKERNGRAIELLDLVARWLDETNREEGPDRAPLKIDLTEIEEY